MRTRFVQLISTLFVLTFILANPALADSHDGPDSPSNTPPATEPEKRSLVDKMKKAARRLGPTAVGCFVADLVTDKDVCQEFVEKLKEWIREAFIYLAFGWFREACVLPLPSTDPSVGPDQTFINPDCWRQL